MADVEIPGEVVRNKANTILLTGTLRVVSEDTELVYNAAGTLLLVGELMATGVGTGGGEDLLIDSYDYSSEFVVDTFSRAEVGGYTGSGDADDYQREAAVDVLRNAHFEGGEDCVLLEDIVTPCALVAPGNIVVTPDGTDYDFSFDPIPVTGSLLRYETRLDGAGSWVSNGTSTTGSGSSTGGNHTLNVRAVSTSGVAGVIGSSSSFELTASYTYLVQQDFEGTGYDHSETWTESGSAVDEDYTGTILEGSQSCRVNPSAATSYTYRSFTATSPITICMMVRIGSITGFTDIASVQTSAGGARGGIAVDGSSHWRIRHGAAVTSTSAGTYATGTTYYLWFEYAKGTGANGTASLYVSTTTTRPGSPAMTAISAGTGVDDIGRLVLGHTSSTTQDIVFDHIRVIPAAAGVVTAWPA